MKKMNNKAMGQLPLILIIAVILIGAIAYVGNMSSNDAVLEKGAVANTSGATQYEGDLTLTVKDWQGAAIGDATLTGYLTEFGAYADIYEAEKALADDGGLKSPFGTVAFAPNDAADGTSGAMIFTGVIGTDAGMKYDLFVTDTDTGVGGATYGDQLYTIVVQGNLDSDGGDVVKAVSSAAGATAGKTVSMYIRGDITVVDLEDTAATSYTREITDNASQTDKTFGFEISSLNDYSKVEGMTIYFSEIDNFVSTSDVTVNEITVDGKSVSWSEVADLDAQDPIRKNKPTIALGAGTGGTLYVIDDESYSLTRLQSDNKDSLKVVVTYDVDASAATTDDTSHMGFYMTSWNGQEDSEEETETFLIKLDESASSSIYA